MIVKRKERGRKLERLALKPVNAPNRGRALPHVSLSCRSLFSSVSSPFLSASTYIFISSSSLFYVYVNKRATHSSDPFPADGKIHA